MRVAVGRRAAWRERRRRERAWRRVLAAWSWGLRVEGEWRERGVWGKVGRRGGPGGVGGGGGVWWANRWGLAERVRMVVRSFTTSLTVNWRVVAAW